MRHLPFSIDTRRMPSPRPRVHADDDSFSRYLTIKEKKDREILKSRESQPRFLALNIKGAPIGADASNDHAMVAMWW